MKNLATTIYFFAFMSFVNILQHKNNIANFATRYKMELTRTS